MSRATFAGALIVVFAGQAILASTPNEDALARQHYLAGQRAQAAGSYQIAAHEYLKVIAIMPQAAEAYASLGLVYNAEDNFFKSTQALKRANALKPGLKGVSLYLGIDLVKLNRPQAAIERLKEAIRLEPDNKQAWLWLSTALLDSGHTAKGLDSLRKANALFPSDPVILLHLGDAYRGAADAGIAQILAAATGQPLVHQIYGDIYRDERIWAKARGHYHRAIAENKNWTGAHLGLGEVALQQGQLEDAEREFWLELKINPSSAAADAKLAEVSLLEGNAGDALLFLKKAVEIEPAEAFFALNLSTETTVNVPISGTLRQRLRSCIPGVEKAPASPWRSLALAFVNQRLENGKSYTFSWKEFQSQISNHGSTTLYKAALNRFYSGQLILAESELQKWHKAKPNDLEASYLLARTYRRLSLSVLRRLLATAPDSYPARTLLAETYENDENYEKAISEYRVVERMAPDLPGVHYALGHLLAKVGHPQLAIAELKEALKLNPNHASANAELGSVLLEMGKQNESIAFLKKAVAIDPDLWVAHRNLGEIYYKQGHLGMAELQLQKAINHDVDGSAHFQLGLIYRAMGKTNEAKEMLARAQQIKAGRFSDSNAARSLPGSSQP